MQRNKTKLEKLLSFNRYRKRKGASEHAPETEFVDFEKMKSKLIDGEEIEKYESEAFSDLDKHMDHLKLSFQGKPELLFYHAKLIVMIRREYKVKKHYKAFEELWNKEHEFLLSNLNLRWIISACDTFIDYSDDDALSGICLAIVMLVNTVNMYESERHFWDMDKLTNANYKENKIPENALHLLLFDGLEGILPERGDTLRNMRWRMDSMGKKSKLGGSILSEVFYRLNNNYSVYSRFKPLHQKQRTQWWD